MKWQSAEKDDQGNLKVPATWLFAHYYDALTVLFRVENALRLFVYVVLKDRYGAEWKDLEIASDEEAKTSIAALARRRIEQGKTFGYLSYPIQSPLMHLTSGELVRLITHDSYWPVFKDYFLAARSVVTLKLQEIGTIRNALAHFRPLSTNDVEVVKQNANQMLSQVERTLTDLVQCGQNVPTNTPDHWYTQLRTLGTDLVSLGFAQSVDEAWVRIVLRHKVVVASGTPNPERGWQSYRVTSIDAPAVLKVHPVIRSRALFVTERVPLLELGSDLLPHGLKEVCLTFSRRVLAEAHAELKQALEDTLALITKETELLREDQLARGTLVQLRGLTARRPDSGAVKRWWVDRSVLHSQSPTEELPEYWGRIGATQDFISDTELYPWMPVKVAEQDVPF